MGHIDGGHLLWTMKKLRSFLLLKGTFGSCCSHGEAVKSVCRLKLNRQLSKDRRIENQKRSIFQAKVKQNPVLVALAVGLIATVLYDKKGSDGNEKMKLCYSPSFNNLKE